MSEIKNLTEDQLEILSKPLPAGAVSPHPSKKFLSSIKSIYVTERLNEVFGVGKWRTETELVDKDGKMVVVKLKFSIPEYGIYYECYGGNDNSDLGDAYKGATTDAITKVASWLGIAAEVFKDKKLEGPSDDRKRRSQPAPAPIPDTKLRKQFFARDFDDKTLYDHAGNPSDKGKTKTEMLLERSYKRYADAGYPSEWNVIADIRSSRDIDDETAARFASLFESYKQAMNNNR